MMYHPEDFLRLMEAVEEDGGMLLSDPCQPKAYRLQIPDQVTGEKKHKQFFTHSCGQDMRVAINYRKPRDPVGEQSGIIGLCAACDDLGKWPRFQTAIQEDSY